MAGNAYHYQGFKGGGKSGLCVCDLYGQNRDIDPEPDACGRTGTGGKWQVQWVKEAHLTAHRGRRQQEQRNSCYAGVCWLEMWRFWTAGNHWTAKPAVCGDAMEVALAEAYVSLGFTEENRSRKPAG